MKNGTVAPALAVVAALAAPVALGGQTTVAERLGYEPDAKLLIVHADDIGVARSVNAAVERAFASGGITSGSVMVPCPWFPDFAAYYREHGPFDVGIHITLTAEWDHYKWGGVAPANEIPSLLDEYGHFYATVEEVAEHAVPVEVEREVRAQIERAMAMGIQPTHLDTHMGTMLFIPELVEIYLRLGREYHLPVMVPRSWPQGVPEELLAAIPEGTVMLDGLYSMLAVNPARTWSEVYGMILGQVGPGLNQLIVHVGIDDEELRAITVNHPDFGSQWRQWDLDFVTSDEFRRMLEENDIHLVTWEQIQELM